jgi:hypothetical protein
VGADVKERVVSWSQESLFGLAAMKRCDAAASEAFKRLQKAKSKDEKVKAVIDYVTAHRRMSEELNDRDRQAKDIIDLIDSETPLDREERRRIAERLQELLFLKPVVSCRWQDIADDLYQSTHADMMKQYLRVWAGLSAGRAEEEVADHLGIEVGTLKTAKLRAKRAMRKLLGSVPSPVGEGAQASRRLIEKFIDGSVDTLLKSYPPPLPLP